MTKPWQFRLRSLALCVAAVACSIGLAREYYRRQPRVLTLEEEAGVDFGMTQDEVIGLIGYPMAKLEVSESEVAERFGDSATNLPFVCWKYRVDGDLLFLYFEDDKVVDIDGATGCEYFE